MAHVEYLLLLCAGWGSLLWVDRRYGTGVLRCWRRLLPTLAICLGLFLAWDSLGVHRGYWRSRPSRVLGIWILPGVPIEELLLLSMITFASIVLWRLLNRVAADSERRERGRAARR
ncbi:MAG TPA: lycopene cyclase domain-containing protein [Dehalococcoidia bacterium]|nr:lycopene cyclase domain-containing protein [Dehalococcoidia bacterium]